jgi:predicted O-methyltransferase YrrM
MPWRMWNALQYLSRPLRSAIVWVFRSREHYNYTYDLDPLNKRYLTSFVAVITGRPFSEIQGYISEIENDQALRSHIRVKSENSVEKYVTDPEARYGRRIGWYALIRATKPKVVVETGMDKGLGTCVMAAAILRNRLEGHPGKIIAIDINPEAGFLFSGGYEKAGEFRVGDSLQKIQEISEPVDFFIHDSDHSAEHERRELSLVNEKLSPNALVLSDNADQTGELLDFAESSTRSYLFFADKPKDHWWAGDGIGVAFRSRQ